MQRPWGWNELGIFQEQRGEQCGWNTRREKLGGGQWRLWAEYGHCPAKATRRFLASFFIICTGTSSCPQVPNSLCSSLTLALLGSAFFPLLCSLASLGNLPTRPVTKYAGSQLHPGSWKTADNLPPLRLMQIQVQVLAWPPTKVCDPGCVI